MQNIFELKISDLNWIDKTDETQDLCAHARVFVRIDHEIVVDETQGNGWTVSAAALYLMRTINSDYQPGDFPCQLIPCCGFNMYIADDPLQEGRLVNIFGCPTGYDWTVKHAGEQVTLITASGGQATLSVQEYKQKILSFADRVAAYYKASKPKTMPENLEDRQGYESFWAEWHWLRSKWN